MLRSCRGSAGRPAGVASLTCERESNTSAGPRRHVGSSDVAPRPFGHTNHRLFRSGPKSASCGLQSRDPTDGVKMSPLYRWISRARKAQASIPASWVVPGDLIHHPGPVWAALTAGFRDCPQAFVLLPPPSGDAPCRTPKRGIVRGGVCLSCSPFRVRHRRFGRAWQRSRQLVFWIFVRGPEH